MSPEPITRQITLRCGLEAAFEAYTQRINLWWPPSHRRPSATIILEPGQGGRLYQRLPDGQELIMGHVIDWQPPTQLSYRWYPGLSAGATRVTLSFLATGASATLLSIHHAPEIDPTDQWERSVARFIQGWDAVLPALLDFTGSLNPSNPPNL